MGQRGRAGEDSKRGVKSKNVVNFSVNNSGVLGDGECADQKKRREFPEKPGVF